MTDLELALEHWQTMAALQVKFIEALAQYKAEVAKAELVEAVTAGEWAVARMKAQHRSRVGGQPEETDASAQYDCAACRTP